MYIRIQEGNTKFEKISNLSFAPEADFISESMPINQFSVDVHTKSDIEVSQRIGLYDDSGTRWARYWIIESTRISEDVVRIVAQSLLVKLERVVLPPKMYNNNTMGEIVPVIMSSAGISSYTLHSSFNNVAIKGYCPEQTAKERLQWICFVTGACIKTFFSTTIDIVPIDSTTAKIPMNKTFWKPSIAYTDIVTHINLTAFEFRAEPQPVSGYEYVEADGVFYQVVRHKMTGRNDAAIRQKNLPTTEINIEDITLINLANVDNVLRKLEQAYFARTEVTFDAVNNGKYLPLDRVQVHLFGDDIAVGIIRSCNFAFGKQARSTINMMVLEKIKSNILYISYVLNHTSTILATAKYKMPAGNHYQIENPYLDQTNGDYRHVYYPLLKYTTGDMPAQGKVEVAALVDKALVMYKPDGLLAIASVDSVHWLNEDEKEVLVIE